MTSFGRKKEVEMYVISMILMTLWVLTIAFCGIFGGSVGLTYALSHVDEASSYDEWPAMSLLKRRSFYRRNKMRIAVFVPIGVILGVIYGVFWPITFVCTVAVVFVCFVSTRPLHTLPANSVS